MALDKRHFIDQLKHHYEEILAIAHKAEVDAREAAKTLATESEKREDSRVALEYGSLATGQSQRFFRARAELKELLHFSNEPLPEYRTRSAIGVGALIDVACEGVNGPEERTFLMLPVGAGTELTGPGGDGFISVITPVSPVGKALLGRRSGESIDVKIRDDFHEWTVLDVG